MRRSLRAALAAATILSLALAGLVAAADHLDGAAVQVNHAADINDVYVFQGADAANTVLSFDVNPAAGVVSGTTFDPGVEYVINVDTDADAVEDITYSITFAAPAAGTQAYTVLKDGAPYATGVTGGNTPIATGGQVFAGLVDDPFYFDLDGFRTFKASILDPMAAVDASGICNTNPDVNFFAGFNASAIVLEVPDTGLATTIGVWAETRQGVGGTQIDRMGKPGINTIFLHTDATKDGFNAAEPADDVADYTDDVAGTTSAILQKAFGYTMADGDAHGATVAGALLADTLVYDTTTAANFGMLNGRALTDDVIDIAYSVVLDGNVTSDCVASDSAFRASFPYWAVANVAAASPTPTPAPTAAAATTGSPAASVVPNTASPTDASSTPSLTLLAAASVLLVAAGSAMVVTARSRGRR
jgi:hypothetical protein